MIKLIFGMMMFFACYPITGCTVTPQQTQATVDVSAIIGKTISEVVGIYGNPVDMFSVNSRDLNNSDTVDIYDYEGFSVVFENEKAVAVHYTLSEDVKKGLQE